MDLDYDQKFEEMKKYIPFLESMIKRLESTNNGVKNPRKAQLDKIRSLRDLLLDKKKRMKMENLLKCEQVLVNLYAKVEQRDSMADSKEDCTEKTQKEKSDLNVVRNKLKSVVSKLQDDDPETLPEIARATNTEVVCTPGSKEPALFQRRPNKASPQLKLPSSRNDDNMCCTKRNYTRVLMSPDHKKKEWLGNSETNTEKLFSRRSPRRSPRRYSPSYKKERKKLSRQRSKSSQHSKDLNITLNVPEESLGSLNTKDILSRIINCSDSDVDIDTLRGLRSQILGELKQTGSKDDISDLILKSYKNKGRHSKKKVEVEEGELSDSESEAIENIYGSLVVVNEDESSSNTNKVSGDKKQPRKIQICLVINSDKEKENSDKINDQKLSTTLDVSDFESYTEPKTPSKSTTDKVSVDIVSEINTKEINEKEMSSIKGNSQETEKENQPTKKENMSTEEENKTTEEEKKPTELEGKEKENKPSELLRSPLKIVGDIHTSPQRKSNTNNVNKKMQNTSVSDEKPNTALNESFQPNFYQQITEEKLDGKFENQNCCKSNDEDIDCCNIGDITSNLNAKKSSDLSSRTKMKKDVVSEIDILQALKKEILGETPSVTLSETITPSLHQPKITKVASALEIAPKKRISLENYKQKSVPSIKQPLFNATKHNLSSKEDNSKKQSLKLTEKECERFNFPVNVSPVESSDDEDKSSIDINKFIDDATHKSANEKHKPSKDLEFPCGSSAPKSPDHEDFADTGIKPPVIIPSDPVKNVVVSTKADVDMRTLIPSASSLTLDGRNNIASPSTTSDQVMNRLESEASRKEKIINKNEKVTKSVIEPRTTTDSNQSMPIDSSGSYLVDSDRLQRPNPSYPNVTSNISTNITPSITTLMSLTVPHMTQTPDLMSSVNQILPSILNTKIPLLMNPNMTPNMNSGMAPNIMNKNHNISPSLMVPSLNPMMTPILTPNARSYEMTPRPNVDDDYPNQKHVYAPIFPTFEPHDFLEKDALNMLRNHNDRFNLDKRLDSPHFRLECPSTPNPSFGRIECPLTPNPSFGRMECPPTPNPSFGRMECPPTPNPSFGRMECPLTPNPSFGRMECPPTPNPSFGRMECPLTPNPSFGRMETPLTPVHSFGRSDCPMTPSHPFGRSESGRTPTNAFGSGDYYHNTSAMGYKYTKCQDPRLNRSSDYDKYQNRHDERNRSYFEDDRNIADNRNRYTRNHAKSFEQVGRNNRDSMPPRRESSVGRSFSRDYDKNEFHSKDLYYRREKYRSNDDVSGKRDYRERNLGRNASETRFNQRERGRTYTKDESLEKPISVQSHTGRSFDIDTSFKRTFQETKPLSFKTSFDDRRRRASSVGRSLRESHHEDLKPMSMNNTKLESTDLKAMRYRRACSVGRELKDYNKNKNFNDVKEDLRSCKFNNYDFKLGDQNLKSKNKINNTHEKRRSNQRHGSIDARFAYTSSSKSGEQHINRDPRTKRDINNCRKSQDNSKYSPRKNVRDPRMRREVDFKTASKDKYEDKDKNSDSCNKNYGIVYSSDNIAKGTILASVAGVKNFKIPKIKRPADEEEVENKNKANGNDNKKEGSHKNDKKEKNVFDENKRGECKQDSSSSSVITSVEKRRNLENSKENVIEPLIKSNLKEDDTASNKIREKEKSKVDEDMVKLMSDTCDRYITRSVSNSIKSGTPSIKITKTTPIKKLRRIKKPVINDSDSDSQDNESKNANISKNIEETKNTIKIPAAENQQINDKKNTDERSDNNEHVETKPYTTYNCHNPEVMKDEDSLDKKDNPTLNTMCEDQSESLDMSFGVDDDLFPDNIASESVLDNINALIAGLDHDIEAPKIIDFNDKFIDNIVGSISPVASIPPDGNNSDLTTGIMLNNKIELPIQDIENCSSTKNTSENVISETTDEAKTKNNFEFANALNQSKMAIESKMPGSENNVEKIDQEYSTKSNSEIQEFNNNFNTDAIVSTTANDGKPDESSIISHTLLSKNYSSNYPFVPDSTISSHESEIIKNNSEQTETCPDSTNEIISEMNNDITSTQNSIDSSTKKQSSASTSSADDIPRLESIGKLLSILEDKNKIQELLTMLGKDSSDNEKIKKKLEKLSEIVSDDDKLLKDKSEKEQLELLETGTIADKSELSPGINKLIDVTATSDRKIEEEKPTVTEQLLEKETVVDIEVKDQCKNTKDQDKIKVDTSLPESKSLESMQLLVKRRNDGVESNDVVLNEIGEQCVGEASNDKDAFKTIISTEETKNNDIVEEDLKTNAKGNQDSISKDAHLKTGQKVIKKSKMTKRGRSRLAKKLLLNKEKRVTRLEVGSSHSQVPPVVKKPSRELLKLQEDIRDMFISEDILNATGIRMCRLAKLGNNKQMKVDTQTSEVEPAEPIVVLENINSKMPSDELSIPLEKNTKKKTTKNKRYQNEEALEFESKGKPKYKPGPKSKTKKQEDDPYFFETDSLAESNHTVDSKDQNTDSDSDSVSTKSFESSELLVELKKKTKRKKRSWQLGVIKKKGAKNKLVSKHTECSVPSVEEHGAKDIEIPNLNCFTDKSYCFYKNVESYLCQLCGYRGSEIVPHYKKHHPHSEIPLSRLNPVTAKQAIEQCENMNLQQISKIQTLKYVCRFCFEVFRKPNTALERFFWHVVSVHTGEYKQLCSECINVTRCPFHLDIPPPPKKGQLFGYICGRCNFTQVSLDNLKTHVIIRHDDEHTEVYSINLGEIPRKILQSLLSKASESSIEAPRVLRSTRSNQSLTEPSDDYSDITDSTDGIAKIDMATDKITQEINETSSPKISVMNKIQYKLIFENDDQSDTSSYSKNDDLIKTSIKLERDDQNLYSPHNDAIEDTVESDIAPEPEQETQPEPEQPLLNSDRNAHIEIETRPTDVLKYPHFKIKLSNTGTKEYVCCINGIDNHYKTTLLISFKKHVQLKHPENWDGYCFVCTVIVTAQGKHTFKDCLEHFLDKHIDNFPILEEIADPTVQPNDIHEPTTSTPIKDAPLAKQYVSVRPLSDLISSEKRETSEVINSSMPKLHSLMSLGISTDSDHAEPRQEVKVCNYEETQAEVMTKKHRIVLEVMLVPEKLIQIFKCAGRFCSYTTNNAEEALVHASTHQKIGGENALRCCYCDFDSSGNAIDLVMHVFKSYSHCSYACSKCFYRAAGSQLVYAHVKRVHTELEADKIPILSSGTIVKDNTKDDLLSRDDAVLYYICKNQDPVEGDTCQFKSYVLTKFREHLQTKHANDPEYICYMCNTATPSSKLLAQHLKSHGLRIYQCCRCLFGADSETELTAHASEKHPFKQPKAYLRIITSKGGSSEVRVLPLAVLSKSSVETTVVTPSNEKESPVKQAERSIDLEKLIGHTNLMIESMSTITNSATIEPVDVTADDTEIQVQSEQASCSTTQEDSGRTTPATLTLLRNMQEKPSTPSGVIKSEPKDNLALEVEKKAQPTPTEVSAAVTADPDVVCLDSDEESSRHNIIDLSNDDTVADTTSTTTTTDTTATTDTTTTTTTAATTIATNHEDGSNIRLPRASLYKCYKCSVLCKSEGMFKRHILSCFLNPNDEMKCAYCVHVTSAILMVSHYNNNHLEASVPYICAICDGKFSNMKIVKRHMKLIHNTMSTVVTSKKCASGSRQFIVDVDLKERQAPKRKLSGDSSNKTMEPANKMKKFGLQDIDKLPINPILDSSVCCALCEFTTKVRLNMVRHLMMHAEQQPVPRTAPVNPVPHLESNEKHFDKMLNLASSSIANNKTTRDNTAAATAHLSPEAAAIYPKYVSDRIRFTCGARDCSYISVNESIFKIHWETLHAGTNDYHCVHCPPHQCLDTSKPLTAARIIAHLKMHDEKLYGCSSCTFYHYIRKFIEKHLKEVHSGKVVIIREDGATVPPPPPPQPQPSTAPTMDLKPWQCGLCPFKSMLCPEVVEHCGKFHQSKMQFKCTNCGFRTSNIDNISKHQSKQHPGKKEDVFYFYYREGSVPNEPDGTPRWQKQSQRNEPEIKTESDVQPGDVARTVSKPPPKPPTPVNLDIVKKEVVESDANVQNECSVEELCKKFGQFCEPNGLNYKCSLCKIVIEDTKEAMQSHLYEELQYRKWGCSVCSYKAFHKPGLQSHVQTEHKASREVVKPVELPVDRHIEAWVAKLLEHQTAIINRNKENFAKQKAEILRANPTSSAKVVDKPAECPKSGGDPSNVTMAGLEKLFGPFGVSSNMNYTCPKCNTSARSEAVMQEHLEAELNKIRWYCNTCGETYQTYHEAQFHCRSVHAGQAARPLEATKNLGLRNAWVAAALRVQKLSMNYMPVTETAHVEASPQPDRKSTTDNSLLVVRYEEQVATPEELMKLRKKSSEDKASQQPLAEEPDKKKTLDMFQCNYCSNTYRHESYFQSHVLKHYGLKPFTCPYCPHTSHKKNMETHITLEHPNKPLSYLTTSIPSTPPVPDYFSSSSTSTSVKPTVVENETRVVCLVCEDSMTKFKSQSHLHNNVRPQFGYRGTVVYRCWICLTLHKTCNDYNLHCKQVHANEKKMTSFYKLQDDTRSLFCSICKQRYNTMAEYRLHHQQSHGLNSGPEQSGSIDVIEIDEEMDAGGKRKANDNTLLPVAKKVAKKSTTKLPYAMTVAKKSTAKLPFNVPPDEEEYSYYGRRPSMDNLENVTTLMPFCNTFVPFSLKKLNEIIKIHPIVIVKDINDKR